MQANQQFFFIQKIFSISLITFVSRIFGLVREVVITALLGTSLYSDAFYLAYAIPNLFRRFTAEGAVLTTFIPVFTKLRKKKGAQQTMHFSRDFFWSLAFVLGIFCLLFLVFTPWLISNIFARGFSGLVFEQSIFLTRIMFIYILLISLTAVYQSILNYHFIFYPSAFSPILLNIIIIIGGFSFGDSIDKAALGLSLGVVLGGVAQFLYLHFSVGRLQYCIWGKIKLFDQQVLSVFRKMLGGIFSAGIYQINIIIGYTIASGLDVGSITSLTISNRIIEFTLGILIVSITTVLLPQLAKLVVEKKIELVKQKLQEALLLSSFVTIPATIGLLLTGEYIIRILFFRGEFDERSVLLTIQVLVFHGLGLFFIAWNRIFTANLHSFQLFRRPAYLAFFAMLVNVFFCWWGVQFFSHAAIALASSISQAFLLILNLCFIPRQLGRFWNKIFFMQIGKQVLASGVLFFILYFLQKILVLENIYFNFFILFFISILTYFVICFVLKVSELKNILVIFQR